MDDVVSEVEMDLRRVLKKSGMTVREAANLARISYETMRGYLYRGKLPGTVVTYCLATTFEEIRLRGPLGTVVMKLEDDRNPPPASSAVVIPMKGRDAA